MSTSVGGQIITAPDISTLALLADIQYFEPYSASALNRKMRGVVLPGIYSGFTPRPGGGLNLLITSADVGTGALSVDVGAYYQVNVQQIKDILIPLSAGRSYIIVCEGNYAYGTLTKQVSTSSNIDAARIFAIPVTQALAQNQLELCRLTIPNGATAITQQMIDGSHRITRALGVLLSDATNSPDPTVAASSKAVKDALDAAKADSATRLVAGAMGIGAQAINFAQNFDWQTYTFHGDEYVLIDWGAARNNPPLGYPNGAYQITVMGLSNTDNQSLIIRPVNELQPLAPFIISWTGVAGARDFRFRAIDTTWNDISNLAGVTPDSLTKICNTGSYSQLLNANALAAFGYPTLQAGRLTVAPGAYGVMQEYTTYLDGRKFVRGTTSALTLGPWREIPNLSNDLLVAGSRIIGVAPNETNRVYLDNRAWGANQIVGGVRSEWYGHNAYAGLRRSGDVNILGYSIEVDGAERLRIGSTVNNMTIAQLFLNQVEVYDDNPAYCLYNKSGTQLANMQANAATGSFRIWNGDTTTLNIQNGMIQSVGKRPNGPGNALLRGEVDGSGWADWRARSSGLQLDMPYAGTAYSIWKATRWGDIEVAAMSAARLGTGSSVRLHVGATDFIFDENGDLAAYGVISAANGQTRLAGNSVYVEGPGNKHLWFNNAAGKEVGLVYASDDNVLHLRAAQGPSLDIDSAGNLKLNGPGSFTVPNVSVINTLSIGQNNSGLSLAGNSLYFRGTGNKLLGFNDAAGNEVGLIYASDDKTLRLRAAQGPTLDIDSGANLTLNGFGTFSSYKANIKNTLDLGDKNSGLRLTGNSVVILGTGNKHLWFHDAAGNEVGLVYASDDKVLHLRAAQGPTLDMDSGANLTLNGVGTFSSHNVYVRNSLNIGDNDSGLWANSDGTVSIRSNSAQVGYWNPTDFTLSINLKTSGSVNAQNIELLGGEPFIDFHRPGALQDFNVRLINDKDNQLKLVGVSTDTLFNNENGQFIGKGRGSAWSQEFNTTNIAPFNASRFYFAAGDSWCPLIKGEGYKASGYLTAVSFGHYISNLNVFNDPIISATNDNGSFGIWRFNNQKGDIAYWNKAGVNRYVAFEDTVAANYVQNVQRGAPVSPGKADQYGSVEAPVGCVLTNARGDQSDQYGVLITYRPLQIFKNGAWRTIDG